MASPSPMRSASTTPQPLPTSPLLPAEDSPPSPSLPLPQTLWSLQVPLLITHLNQPLNPYLVSLPRFSYLALLLPRLSAFFSSPCSSFHHEDVQLRNLPLGLLVDLYQPAALPWKLTVSDGPEWDIADTFTNSAKEADFIRNGNAKQIMSLSKDDSTALWNSVQDNDYVSYARIQSRLLNTPTPLKNVPIRVYIPSTTNNNSSSSSPPPPPSGSESTAQASFKVVQTLISPRLQNQTPQTLGSALKNILPTLFPSSRDPILANVILHGGPVPFRAPLEDLMREAAYPDGWLCLIVVLL
ncbi:autophagy protein Apg5-domain-containing protein [Cladorrhinum samala]|uniref:Autophagy protein 5 n=1 Tax=Cladorrhinum samala TaxID=585594 RepID=A0AAV9HTN6_9PEZI|nr:autophagy protein Apg5-domain-containing protein [Cladorrhinum samala]